MKIYELILALAMVVFMVSLCTIEALSMASILGLIISGAVIVGCGFYEEQKRMREGR